MTARVDSVVPLDRTARLYGRKICKACEKSIEGFFEVGALLIQAKTELHHGEFERMIESCCPFGKRTAQRLMQLPQNPVLLNATDRSHLPNSLRALAKLAQFEPKELSHAINNHWVTAELTEEGATALHRRVRKAFGKRTRKPSASGRPRLDGLERLQKAWSLATDDQRARFLSQILDHDNNIELERRGDGRWVAPDAEILAQN
jgi:hypothetical protein